MKTIVIAGGSKGIGLELVQLLIPEHKVFVLSRSLGNLTEHPNLTHYVYDFTSNEPLPDIEDKIDGLVYAPGTINLKPFRSLKLTDFQYDWQLNFYGAVTFIQHYLPQLNKPSSIVLFSTVAAKTGMAFHTSIAAAKGALECFSKSLAAETAPDIRVNCIAPSLTKTTLSEKLIANEARLKAAEERHPLKQIGKAADIAKCAQWLLSDASQFITAQTITIDGGISSIK
jgi:NAD(P)-dependent dehydrogenase (short-subunit alcohol dehydrogenase family)